MASGLPVIATDVAGAAEALRHEQEGLLIPPGDIEALRSALQRLMEDDTRRVNLSERGRERIQEAFTVETMGRGALSTYDRLLANPCAA
ncbi:MAG: glycosyltransferase [Verrucomicrobia bacterium]|nr:glycosyltransferase [Verrucomicrobiota bacterium]MBU1909322.1 glycosyltransferase [Verrucomicrobiota bacterium]